MQLVTAQYQAKIKGLEAALRDGDPADALAWLGTAVAQARAAIADMLGVA